MAAIDAAGAPVSHQIVSMLAICSSLSSQTDVTKPVFLTVSMRRYLVSLVQPPPDQITQPSHV